MQRHTFLFIILKNHESFNLTFRTRHYLVVIQYSEVKGWNAKKYRPFLQHSTHIRFFFNLFLTILHCSSLHQRSTLHLHLLLLQLFCFTPPSFCLHPPPPPLRQPPLIPFHFPLPFSLSVLTSSQSALTRRSRKITSPLFRFNSALPFPRKSNIAWDAQKETASEWEKRGSRNRVRQVDWAQRVSNDG